MKIEDWIRCNKCFRMLRDSSDCFSVTQCQHIFCERCVASGPLDKGSCPECKTDGIRLMTLKQPWDQTILAPFCRSLPEMMVEANQAAEFQRAQALIALRRYDQIEKNYEKLKKSYAQNEAIRHAIKQKKQQLEHQIIHFQKIIERASLSSNRETKNFSSSHERNKKQEKIFHCFLTPSDSGHSYHSSVNLRHDGSATELRPRSKHRPPDRVAFTPDTYSPRAVFSDGTTSMTSRTTRSSRCVS